MPYNTTPLMDALRFRKLQESAYDKGLSDGEAQAGFNNNQLHQQLEYKERELARLRKQLKERESLIRKMIVNFDKLARLGNEPLYGNSDGNRIAQDVFDWPEVKEIMGQK